MSIWTKIFNNKNFFNFGGPIGSLQNFFLDFSRKKISKKLPEKIAIKQISFTIGVIALSAKMAKVDGFASKGEFEAFKRNLIIPGNQIKNVERIWNLAKSSVHGFESYAKQLSKLLDPKSIILENLIHLLFIIAKSDGNVTLEERLYIKKIALIFGFNEAKYELLENLYCKNRFDPYKVLGVDTDTPLQQIKTKRIKLLKKYHPDILISKGQPIEFVQKNNQYVQMINKSWDLINKNLRN